MERDSTISPKIGPRAGTFVPTVIIPAKNVIAAKVMCQVARGLTRRTGGNPEKRQILTSATIWHHLAPNSARVAISPFLVTFLFPANLVEFL